MMNRQTDGQRERYACVQVCLYVRTSAWMRPARQEWMDGGGIYAGVSVVIFVSSLLCCFFVLFLCLPACMPACESGRKCRTDSHNHPTPHHTMDVAA